MCIAKNNGSESCFVLSSWKRGQYLSFGGFVKARQFNFLFEEGKESKMNLENGELITKQNFMRMKASLADVSFSGAVTAFCALLFVGWPARPYVQSINRQYNEETSRRKFLSKTVYHCVRFINIIVVKSCYLWNIMANWIKSYYGILVLGLTRLALVLLLLLSKSIVFKPIGGRSILGI